MRMTSPPIAAFFSGTFRKKKIGEEEEERPENPRRDHADGIIRDKSAENITLDFNPRHLILALRERGYELISQSHSGNSHQDPLSLEKGWRVNPV